MTAGAGDEHVILVDGQDREVGLEEKVRCHLPDGRLHRAFTALLFDEGGRLALARRSSGKMLWPGFWDGTFASHPRGEETFASSACRRMPEEMGVACSGEMGYLFKFEYHVPYRDVGSENEICGTVVGTVGGGDDAFDPAPDEISEVRMVSADELGAEVADDPGVFCPWMLIALCLLDSSQKEAMERYGGVLRPWMGHGMQERMREAAGAHLPESRWRLCNE